MDRLLSFYEESKLIDDDKGSLLKVGEIASKLNITVRTLKRWMSAGIFPKADIASGKTYRRWFEATLQAWLERNSTTG